MCLVAIDARALAQAGKAAWALKKGLCAYPWFLLPRVPLIQGLGCAGHLQDSLPECAMIAGRCCSLGNSLRGLDPRVPVRSPGQSWHCVVTHILQHTPRLPGKGAGEPLEP